MVNHMHLAAADMKQQQQQQQNTIKVRLCFLWNIYLIIRFYVLS